ncbi:MAG: hypothetical protein A3C08_00270 [Candidatus Taylorbacteria bacterium RIFCSPHIGHO2_02_FULL_47_18]|uniref:HTH arsR-type domain-containing protein n=1 Tax=Candidatus Taylorbacteria bacterium RIFCSPLOWO2_01_FULL_48_100 TaxID=1802322 RepID=A0A1G2NEF9_9BACT|nr:MAG: hypothetical protein A2670_00015 [Candidatus Taylorbacteria bacterium RIFCSPHIGHO2_01_FULL_48_38]OHA27917.1 MAG: hypothetical protein A3C08_00270 [Candidatus Taylorbacteria bacterium RIFCSPHIGHO2_02_FULL_47_18]OHA34454.1 MAG: hypothetical protein A2938_01255 [Candidatus Taylorbacteria bacterium RIFCSPLOWO2_01_FULL_48_100]OHA40118.1 MAG: hypothetical protein A3J31_00825 [Candidatus Taylorbacteria bacterium RIFCSPLOWO2_02_FULL_48_16]OHA45547.1 MAG: hypothetical protein A3H13_02020 [Candid
MKTPKQLERHFKGVANHRRLQILLLLHAYKVLSLIAIAKNLHCNLKTIAEHTRRLTLAGLVNKKYRGREVEHTLSPYGHRMFDLIKTFSHS